MWRNQNSFEYNVKIRKYVSRQNKARSDSIFFGIMHEVNYIKYLGIIYQVTRNITEQINFSFRDKYDDIILIWKIIKIRPQATSSWLLSDAYNKIIHAAYNQIKMVQLLIITVNYRS